MDWNRREAFFSATYGASKELWSSRNRNRVPRNLTNSNHFSLPTLFTYLSFPSFSCTRCATLFSPHRYRRKKSKIPQARFYGHRRVFAHVLPLYDTLPTHTANLFTFRTKSNRKRGTSIDYQCHYRRTTIFRKLLDRSSVVLRTTFSLLTNAGT